MSRILGVPGTNTQPPAAQGGGILAFSQESAAGSRDLPPGSGAMPGDHGGLRLLTSGL